MSSKENITCDQLNMKKQNVIDGRHFDPLHPNISMHILHTVLHTFLKVLTRRICLPIKRFLPW